MPSLSTVFLFSLIAWLGCVTAVPDDRLGRWGAVFNMEVIPIHSILLPGGFVLSYGANKRAQQGGDRVYEIWDASKGEHHLAENHILKTQQADVNIFCSTLSMDISTGRVLVMGGDNEDNKGVNDVLEFDPETHEMIDHPLGDMKYPRWYGTSVNLPDGRIFIAGGLSGVNRISSSIPEIWDPVNGFVELPGAKIPAMTRSQNVGAQRAWWYPHVYNNSKGDIIIIISDWKDYDIYRVGVEGGGSIELVGKRPFRSDKLGASIMYDVDKVVMLDDEGYLWTVDISDSTNIVFTKKSGLGQNRMNACMALLPDGRVVINGGTSERGDTTGILLEFAVLEVQIWDPVTNTVFTGPKQDIERLYHNSGLILPDGTVYSGGGGAPGPLKNHNGQIYFPGYLFDPNTGELATRPVIDSWPPNIQAGGTFRIKVGDSSNVDKITATKSGSVTHSRNCEARWLNLTYTVVDGTTIDVSTPGRNIMVPGLWNLNTIDKEGVPSEARLFGVNLAFIETAAPTNIPSAIPSAVPSELPSQRPSGMPTSVPSGAPSSSPVTTSARTPSSDPDELLNGSTTSGSSGMVSTVRGVVVSAMISLLLLCSP